LTLTVQTPRLWSLDDPYLYRVTARLESEEGVDERAVRCGFRDFRVVNGYFRLNGKRLFVRSTHTGNHCPVGQILPPPSAPDLLRRDLVYAKAIGFNMVRFIGGMPYSYQLDICDEIGLMVYDESLAGWILQDSPQMAYRYDFSLREMVLRDRNHPSVVVWGLLNETFDSPVFRHAAAAGPALTVTR
jgi:beta-galactosidase/beta-glucuronidase